MIQFILIQILTIQEHCFSLMEKTGEAMILISQSVQKIADVCRNLTNRHFDLEIRVKRLEELLEHRDGTVSRLAPLG